jgi:hypothetical protein
VSVTLFVLVLLLISSSYIFVVVVNFWRRKSLRNHLEVAFDQNDDYASVVDLERVYSNRSDVVWTL